MKVGELAPLFSLRSDEDTKIELSDLKGKNVVLYFYPKDDTPGCTIEAQDFTKKISEFEKLNCLVLGVSKDGVASHCSFVEKYNLAFNLLADESGETCKAYDVLREKSMFGKKYLGIDRSTFLINKLGKISNIWRSVSVKGHVEEVLIALGELERKN
ncbi:MAG: peroxiredoxin [Proteobacteria bacterium]|nr:peroxiredoxin [Pseudomonadota bacterium]